MTAIDAADIPDHDVLVGGFPCQPFSIAGVSKKNALGRPHGFRDPTQGTLFFDVARIIEKKRPRAFLLENVRNLISHDKGNTFRIIRHRPETELGYEFHPRVLDASAVVPQGRRRIFMVGFDTDAFPDGSGFDFEKVKLPQLFPTMDSVLHKDDGSGPVEFPYTDADGLAASKYTLSLKLWTYLQNYKLKHNAAGNGFGFGLVGRDDVARTLSARYYKDGSEILVHRGDGLIPRRLTPASALGSWVSLSTLRFPSATRRPTSSSEIASSCRWSRQLPRLLGRLSRRRRSRSRRRASLDLCLTS
ncbi:DNA (cytosine-5-)-methyltransferase [Nocardioides sp. B-3]|uniref:DNA (cytosine-5-)-methyltransferase n=1 Tax=Nocardioides sp. B-3 TaxID=2895565 RepID=UPI00300E667E